MALYTSTKERFIRGALVKAGTEFVLPEGQKPTADMTLVGGAAETAAVVGEVRPARRGRGSAPETLSEMAEATKTDPVA